MSTALNRTPLFDAHLKAGARMVDFGGWEMPVSYGSQIEEHHAVRQAVGVFDVSHMRSVDLTGPGSRTFLRRLLANDVDKLTEPGRAFYSGMLNPEGGVIDDLIVYFFAPDQWRLVINAACADKDVAWMRRVLQLGAEELTLTERTDLALLAVQGPLAEQTLSEVRTDWASKLSALKPFRAQQFDQTTVARTGYTGEDGFEVMLPAAEAVSLWNDLLAAGVKPCGLGARDTLRLEAGMNLYGQDMDALTLPSQAGLTWTVSLKDPARAFIGRAAIETVPAAGQLLGLRLLEKGVMRAHMAVTTDHGPGEVTSGTMSPTLGFSIAMARLPDAVKVGDQVHVDIRAKAVPAMVCQLPFVRHGKPVDGALAP